MDLKILPLPNPKPRPADESQLGFGKQFTDRMLVMEYAAGTGWHSARIQPYGPFTLDPACAVLHYAQEIFEGLKAFRREDGRIALFRAIDNVRRFNRSAARMCMPEVDEAFFLDAIRELVRLEADWVPHSPGTALYIRPTMIAVDPYLGVKPADNYLCYVILSPVGAYYKGGFSPVKIWISDEYVRAALGGTGEAKTGGNYAASLLAQRPSKGADDKLLDELTRQVLQVRQQSLSESVNQLRFMLEDAQQAGEVRAANYSQLMLQYGRRLNRLDEARRKLIEYRRK